jgi:hypothetical protein
MEYARYKALVVRSASENPESQILTTVVMTVWPIASTDVSIKNQPSPGLQLSFPPPDN